ncbi:MAG: peptidase [Burkholderia sp.]|jgi:predicted double-glycine peptidase|nr:peptidase [Burkholderia sp.]
MKTFAVLPGVILAGIAHAGTLSMQASNNAAYRIAVTSLKEVRFKATIRQQYDFSCGSAAIATLLTYHYGYAVNEQMVFEEMYLRGDQRKIRQEGFSLLDMKMFLQSRSFQADGFQLPLEKLEAARLPAIVLLADNGYRHFVVIKGIRDGRVLVGDPSSGTRAIPRDRFESLWVGKLLFVIHNHQKLAKFNQELDWRAAPRSPMANGVVRDGLDHLSIPKLGPGDF